jgi:regulatory protein
MDRPAKRIRPKLDAAALFDYSVAALAARAHTSAEIRRKLRAKADKAGDVDQVIARLRDYGYLNDRKYAESFAGIRLENQGLGKARVLRELKARSVTDGIARHAVEQAYRDVNEDDLIRKYVERRILKFTSGERLGDEKELASAYRKLIRAGFSSGTSLRVLKQMARNPGQFDEFDPPEPSTEPEA